VFAADLRRPHAAFLLCQDRDNLFLGEPRLPYVRVLLDGLIPNEGQIGAQVRF
jgi:hypothetical protein